MRSRVAWATSPRPLSTRETVGADTPASAAMAEMVTAGVGVSATAPPSCLPRVQTPRAAATSREAPRYPRARPERTAAQTAGGALTPLARNAYCPSTPSYGNFRKLEAANGRPNGSPPDETHPDRK